MDSGCSGSGSGSAVRETLLQSYAPDRAVAGAGAAAMQLQAGSNNVGIEDWNCDWDVVQWQRRQRQRQASPSQN